MEEDQDSETIILDEYDEKPEKPMEQINMTINQNIENRTSKEINEKKPKLRLLPSLKTGLYPNSNSNPINNNNNRIIEKAIPLIDVRRMSRGVTINQNNPMRIKANNSLLQLFIIQANIEKFLNSMLREYPENQYIINEISTIKVNNDNYFMKIYNQSDGKSKRIVNEVRQILNDINVFDKKLSDITYRNEWSYCKFNREKLNWRLNQIIKDN